MKFIPPGLLLSIILYSCMVSYNRAEPAINSMVDTYVILKSGEKIKNIASSKWKPYNVNITAGDRVIDPAAIRWIRDPNGLWLMCRGIEYKCDIEGDISVFHNRNIASSRLGSPLHPVNYFILLKGENILNRRLNFRNLAEAMEDNAKAVALL